MFPKKSVGQLLEKLHPSEELIKVASCNSGTKAGAFAITNERIVFSHKSMFATEWREFKISTIKAVNLDSGMTNTLRIKVGSKELSLSALDKATAEELVSLMGSRKKGKKH